MADKKRRNVLSGSLPGFWAPFGSASEDAQHNKDPASHRSMGQMHFLAPPCEIPKLYSILFGISSINPQYVHIMRKIGCDSDDFIILHDIASGDKLNSHH